MRIAVERARGVDPEIKLGICSEHGGDARSVAFCHELGLAYVSCSPYRVPLARLAAAQAVLAERGITTRSRSAARRAKTSCSKRRAAVHGARKPAPSPVVQEVDGRQHVASPHEAVHRRLRLRVAGRLDDVARPHMALQSAPRRRSAGLRRLAHPGV